LVASGHHGGPTKPLYGIGNSLIVCCNQNTAHQRRLLDAPVNVLDEGFPLDYDDRFSREAGGIESGGDDRYGGIDLHQNTAIHLSMVLEDRAGPLAENLQPVPVGSGGNFKREKPIR